jgi:DNA-binding transcriptional LysR family regulator
MDQLGAIVLFNKVVETGSFSEAGRQSNLVPSTVSRRIVALEGWVGATLFHRTTRKLNLTEVGRLFHERTRSIMLDLEEARIMAAALEDKPAGLVRITLPASLEQHVVVATALFQARWPDVSFGLTSTDRNVDLVAEGFDIAIRAGRLKDSTLRARKLAEVPRRLCASPQYLATAPCLAHPRDIENHSCLALRRNPGDNLWQFKDGGEIVDVTVRGKFTANSGNMLVTAARHGRGLMLSPDWIMGPHIARGELVKLLPGYSPYPAISALFHPR